MRNPAILFSILLLASCGTAEVVEVVDRTAEPAPRRALPRSEPRGSAHVVARGETLYGISFKHGVDFRRLADLNGIEPPYTIYPGQRLRLDASRRASPRPIAREEEPPHVGPLPLLRPSPAAPAASQPSQRGDVERTAPARSRLSTAMTGADAETAPAPTAPATGASTVRIAADRMQNSAGINWRWPANGSVLNRFVAGDPARQGIDIRGTGGAPVRAVADGEVVYSGNGLLGYGELIIIKHSNAFLSAYGHNRRRLLGEGARVEAGQQIAEMGRSGAGLDVLHFEIRRNGKPVDPLGFLPPR